MIHKALFSSDSDERGTPLRLYKELDDEFHFSLDPCTTKDNPLDAITIYTKEEDGLSRHWINPTFCNPPYSDVANWVHKAKKESDLGVTSVLLLAARTDTRWFHEYIYNKENVEIRFIKGRLKFGNSKNSAPFPSMIVIFRS